MSKRAKFLGDEKGQMFAGYIVALLILIAIAVTVMDQIRRMRKGFGRIAHREQAVQVARAGFEEAVAYFRTSPTGVFLAGEGDAPKNLTSIVHIAPTNHVLQASSWGLWPDAAFMPQITDVDAAIYNSITVATYATSGLPVTSAAAMVRTYPMSSFSNLSTNTQAGIWGRYVVKRQNVRNFSPTTNAYAQYTDPDAVHDLTHIRSVGEPGSGNYWAITSYGYVFANSLSLPAAAAFEGGNPLNPPLGRYQGRRQLLARAKVYGEIFRMNFNPIDAAVFVSASASLQVRPKGSLIGGAQRSYAFATGAVTNVSSTGGSISGSAPSLVDLQPNRRFPTLSSVFPGLDKDKLRGLAVSIDPSKVGGTEVMPYEPVGSSDSNEFTNRVSRVSFYYLTTNARFYSLSRTVMTGVGLVYVNGNLDIEARNNSTWSGIVFVDGNVTIRGPGYISGALIASGTVRIGETSADVSPAVVEYSLDAWQTTAERLSNFHVIDSSVVVSKF